MLVDWLRISAFRGIPTELPLDLSARVTLLHAPNGTGKTSVCDGLEWLLTGKVSRLVSALRDSPTGGVRNLFATDEQTSVQARLSLVNNALTLRRTAVGGAQELEQADPEWRPLDNNQLIENLSPSDLPGGSTRQQNLNRGAWFRAVRLLEAPDLEVLLDDTEGARNLRGILFSNLFGIGDLQSREETLQKIRDLMMRPGPLDAQVARLVTQINEINATLNSAGQRVSEPFVAAARQQLQTASQHLGRPIDQTKPLTETASRLGSLYKIEEDRVGALRNALETITRGWDRFHALSAEISALEKKQAEDTESLIEVRRQHESAMTAARESAMVAAEAKKRQERLRSLQMEVEQTKSRLNEALARWQIRAVDPDGILDAAALQAAEEMASARRELLSKRRVAFQYCMLRLPEWLALIEKLKSAEIRVASLAIPSKEEATANERASNAARNELARLDAEAARLTTPLERLRAEGRHLLDSLPGEHRCPLCTHDYETPDLLRKAIELGLSGLPTALSSLVARKTAQEAMVVQTAENERQWAVAMAEVRKLNESITDAHQRLKIATEALRETGVELPDLKDPKFVEHFRTAEAALDRSIERERQERLRISAVREAGASLALLREQILIMAEVLHDIYPGEFDTPHLTARTALQWTSETEQLASSIDAAHQKASEGAVSARALVETRQRSIETVANNIKALSAAIASRAIRLSELRSETLPFANEWSIAAGSKPITKEILETIPQTMSNLADQLAKGAVELRAAVDNLKKADEAREKEREAIAQASKLNELRAALERLSRIRTRRAQLDQAVTLLRQAREEFINRQIQPLCDVITALYLRAQSNSFITEIGTDESSGVHRWIANIDNRRLESIAQLSQGQRQDLALAIFLARARDVRGTFFLDEPLLHLDDLNRVGLIDVLRVLVLEQADRPLRLVITTASNALVRHFREKFSLVSPNDRSRALRVYHLSGNPQAGVVARED
jgi:DNA repair protein SbcC/Rad50